MKELRGRTAEETAVRSEALARSAARLQQLLHPPSHSLTPLRPQPADRMQETSGWCWRLILCRMISLRDQGFKLLLTNTETGVPSLQQARAARVPSPPASFLLNPSSTR